MEPVTAHLIAYLGREVIEGLLWNWAAEHGVSVDEGLGLAWIYDAGDNGGELAGVQILREVDED